MLTKAEAIEQAKYAALKNFTRIAIVHDPITARSSGVDDSQAFNYCPEDAKHILFPNGTIVGMAFETGRANITA